MVSTATQSKSFTVALVGQPNVGKSVVMNLLTGAGAVVSNYPGTTVEITEGTIQGATGPIQVIDTPGIYSLHSDTPEQRVTQKVLLEGKVDLILNITNARTLARSLYLTLQLLDLEIPMVVILNQMDMAEEAGMSIDIEGLSKRLGVPVVPMVASKGAGLATLKNRIFEVQMALSDEVVCPHCGRLDKGRLSRASTPSENDENLGALARFLGRPLRFSEDVESVLEILTTRIGEIIPSEGGKHGHHTARALAIHLLEHDSMDEELLSVYPELGPMIEQFQSEVASGHPPCKGCFRGCAFCPMSQDHPASLTCLERTDAAHDIALGVLRKGSLKTSTGYRQKLERLLDAPLTGLPLLGLTLWITFLGVIKFMEFAEHWVSVAATPLAEWFAAKAAEQTGLLSALLQSIPDGIILPFTVVMPAMIGIYTAMAILEDSGLLPRIAVMMDRLMSFFGLPGQSTIPLLLGFGCKAPAILGTRALPGKDQRFIISALLAITVPCAASLGIITGLGTTFNARLPVIYGSMAVVFVILGLSLGRTSSGVDRHLVLEIPPLRLPVVSNVISKTWMRLQGFFGHVLPLLVATSIGVQVLLELGVLSGLARLNPISLRWLGVGGESLVGVAVSAIQKYMGPMVLMNLPLSAREATIAGAMVSVSMPCLPVSILIGKEQGWGALAKIFGLALMLSLVVGVVLNAVLPVF